MPELRFPELGLGRGAPPAESCGSWAHLVFCIDVKYITRIFTSNVDASEPERARESCRQGETQSPSRWRNELQRQIDREMHEASSPVWPPLSSEEGA